MRALCLVCLLLVPAMASGQVYPANHTVETRRDADDADAWQSIEVWQVDPQERLIWVRARFELTDALLADGRPLGVHVSATASYDLWWNGTFIGRNGRPGHSRDTEEPGRIQSDVLIPASLARVGSNELLLRMSSFHQPGRLRFPVQIIYVREFGARPSAIQPSVFRLMAGGAFLLGAAYFAALFASNRRDLSSLLLALLSLSVLAQLLIESVRFLVNYLYPFHVVRLRLIVACAGASAVCLVAYLAHRHVRSRWRSLVGLTVALGAACVALTPGYDAKTYQVMLVGLLIAGIAAAIGVRARMPGARLMLAVITVAVILAAIDPASFLDLTYYLAIVVLLLVLFAQQVVDLRRVQRLEAQASFRSARLELELLRQQIQPHFLMNTLTALCEWVESDPSVGVRMIEALGEELRAIATMGEASTVPLAQELDLCRHHLRVMGFRRNRQFSLSANGVDLAAPIPPALFHTLIENAFTHNAQPDGAEFVLAAGRSSHGRRRYELRSTLTRQARPGPAGKGHAYVRARLGHAFGDDWHFSSSATSGQWIDCVEVPQSPSCT